MSEQEAQESSAGGRLIKRYLKDLNRMARVLPSARRKELIQDVRSHIDVALNERENQDTETVRTVLTGLGKPAEIVAAAVADSGVEAAPTRVGIGGHEIAAVLLLLFGAVAVGVGWLAGVLLLWSSPRWALREKLLGTIILPGGLVTGFLVARPASGGSALQTLLMVVALAAPVLVALWLVRQARTAVVVDDTPRWAFGIVAVGAVVLALPLAGLVFFSATRTDQGPSTPASVTGQVVVTPTQSPS